MNATLHENIGQKIVDRRSLLRLSAFACAFSALPTWPICAATAQGEARSLYLYHIHTGERGRFTYWENGKYVPEALLEISWLLRDFRTDEMKLVDKYLLDQLTLLQHVTQNDKGFEVISGYRSAETNHKLFTTTEGVDENSLHMQASALDVRSYGATLPNLYKAAKKLAVGGLGYYPHSNFIHLDSGPVKQWEWLG
jgi:uncharacterized protein YcbK (DUF882 family)